MEDVRDVELLCLSHPEAILIQSSMGAQWFPSKSHAQQEKRHLKLWKSKGMNHSSV